MDSPLGELVVLGTEVGGRWNQDALRLVRRLARFRARAAPQLLRRSAAVAWSNRWWGILSIAVQDALAATIARDGHLALGGTDADEEVPLADVLLSAAPAASPSWLPLRS